jgi:TonB family protein
MVLRSLAVLAVTLQAAVATKSVVLFDGSSTNQWAVEHVPLNPDERLRIIDGPFPEQVDGAMRLGRAPGWIRSKRSFADFRLALSYRRDANSHAGLYFRTWPRLDRSGAPGNGYEVSLGDGPDPRSTGRVIAHGRTGRDQFDPDVSRATGQAAGTWHRLVLECRGDHAEVTIDGRSISIVIGVENPAGYIGLRGETGHVDVRDIVLTAFHRKGSGRIEGERDHKAPGVAIPKLIREVKPAYTSDAMRERITGAVWLEAVVREDGAVGDIEVVRSLDPHFGLDAEAIKALRQWRFAAGTKDGRPIPVVITVELTFTLK